jgi:hypothetical protein
MSVFVNPWVFLRDLLAPSRFGGGRWFSLYLVAALLYLPAVLCYALMRLAAAALVAFKVWLARRSGRA